MRMPQKFERLVQNGLVETVVSQLMSGKEAEVYVVQSMGELRCAKVYKDVDNRSFSKQAKYQEGRKTKNSRQARAMGKHSKFGRKEQEGAWQNAEVDALHRLAAAGVRVPQVFNFIDGVLLMELVVDEKGDHAPRLNDVKLTAAEASTYHREMMVQIVRMLCAGLVHGDLSSYNVLLGSDGLVIIDLPQAIDAAGNNNAGGMLLRDVANITAYFGRFAPELLSSDYGREIWKLYASGELKPETVLTGKFEQSTVQADVHGVMRDVEFARRWHERSLLNSDKGSIGRVA
ncbi:MAG: PA4780 family RIO1-like protein kinase [Trichloromonadaceae bacterium]